MREDVILWVCWCTHSWSFLHVCQQSSSLYLHTQMNSSYATLGIKLYLANVQGNVLNDLSAFHTRWLDRTVGMATGAWSSTQRYVRKCL